MWHNFCLSYIILNYFSMKQPKIHPRKQNLTHILYLCHREKEPRPHNSSPPRSEWRNRYGVLLFAIAISLAIPIFSSVGVCCVLSIKIRCGWQGSVSVCISTFTSLSRIYCAYTHLSKTIPIFSFWQFRLSEYHWHWSMPYQWECSFI